MWHFVSPLSVWTLKFGFGRVIMSFLILLFDEQQTVEALLESGNSLVKEQQLIMETKLSKEYMKNIDD